MFTVFHYRATARFIIFVLAAWSYLACNFYTLKTTTRKIDEKFSSKSYDLHPSWEWARNTSIVYTWVSGSDYKYKAERDFHGGNEYGGEQLDRNNNELLYSMRTVSTYLPWHSGTVFVVTRGQIPAWLNTSHPRIKVVDHKDFMPSSILPTFSSNVIESHFHLIPGLTDIFIYINDDFFVRSMIHPSDIFTPEHGPRLFVNNFTVPLDKEEQRSIVERVEYNPYTQAKFRTIELLKEAYREAGFKPLQTLEHSPYVMHKEVLEKMHLKWENEFFSFRDNKFRNKNDLLVLYMYYGYLIHEGWKSCNLTYEISQRIDQHRHIGWSADMDLNALKVAEMRRMRKLKFLNVNDHMGSDIGAGSASKQLTAFLDKEFGHLTSEFELVAVR